MIAQTERDARALVADAATPESHEPEHGAVGIVEVARVLFVAAAAAAVGFHLWEPIGKVSVIGVVATLVGGQPIFREAFESLRERRMTMALSMTIALLAALSIGQAFTALVITAFVLVAEILEHLTVSRGRAAIGDLLRYLPRTASVRRGGVVRDVDADALRVGDAVLVNPGALVPVDGTVIAGRSFVDEARITGEAMPVEKLPGATTYAGTFNQHGALEIRAERLGRDTSFGRIIDAVESAERSRAPVERLADRLAGYLVYFALGAAVLTYLLTRNVVSTISVIIVAGACGIAAGTPLAVLGAVGSAARIGSIVKGGRSLEALAEMDVVVFDKTGTLTLGTPDVVGLAPATDVSPDELLRVAAVVERRSEHPLGCAIVRHAEVRGIVVAEPEAFTYALGHGVHALVEGQPAFVGNAGFLRANGYTVADAVTQRGASDIHVAFGATYLGAIAIADGVRPEAADAVAALRGMGIRTEMLTGDVERVAAAVGESLGVDVVVAELLPEQKAAYVDKLIAFGHIVAMVGDGVNDAPALARATVGVAMGSGTDVARETADVVLLGNDLKRFVETVRIARRTKGVVMQNFIGTLAVDALGIALAGFGVLNPLFAAFVHVASELTFILNAARMLPARRETVIPAGSASLVHRATRARYGPAES